MIGPPAPPANDVDGVEPEESGAGYGNHAPDPAEKPGKPDKSAG